MSTQIIMVAGESSVSVGVRSYGTSESEMDKLLTAYVNGHYVQASGPFEGCGIAEGEAIIIRGTVMKVNVGLEEVGE